MVQSTDIVGRAWTLGPVYIQGIRVVNSTSTRYIEIYCGGYVAAVIKYYAFPFLSTVH